VFSRRVVPDRDDVAGIAALIAGTFAWFPFAPVLWGGLPTIVAMCQVPAVVDALWRKRDDGGWYPVGALVAVAIVGLVEEHSTEAVAVALFSVVLTASGWRAMPLRERRAIRNTWGVGTGVGAGLLVPAVPELARGLGERVDYLGGGTAVLEHGRWLYTIGNPVIAACAVVGIAIALRRSPRTPLLWCMLASALVFGLAFIDSPATRAVTVPWYSSPARVSYLVVYFEAIFAAVTIASLLTRLRERAAPGSDLRPTSRVAMSAALMATGAVAILPASFESAAFVRAAYAGASPVGPDQRAGFAWLAGHVTAADRVLNEFVDGSGWMETLDDVHPVFATDPETLPIVNPQTQWGDRWYLLTHAAQLANDARAQAAARRWDVRYVYVNTTRIGGYPARLSVTALRASPAFREVWHRGDVTIFRVTVGATS